MNVCSCEQPFPSSLAWQLALTYKNTHIPLTFSGFYFLFLFFLSYLCLRLPSRPFTPFAPPLPFPFLNPPPHFLLNNKQKDTYIPVPIPIGHLSFFVSECRCLYPISTQYLESQSPTPVGYHL